MSKFRFSLMILVLPLFSACATIDAFLFDAYPDGTPIVHDQTEHSGSPATDQTISSNKEVNAEAEALREEIRQQKAELEALKQKRAAEEAAAKEQLWMRISFRSGQTRVTAQTRKVLRDVAKKFLAQPRNHTIAVRGYCDDEPIGGYSGSGRSSHQFDSQVALSQARADAVAAELKQSGIAANAIDAQGFGATAFIAGNDTAEGRNKNRRVDIFLIEK